MSARIDIFRGQGHPNNFAIVVGYGGGMVWKEGAGCSGENRRHVSTSPQKACTPKLQNNAPQCVRAKFTSAELISPAS
jgi:hypothetical protein